jgi:hypothetical protein
VKRPIAFVAGLLLLPLMGAVPSAHAMGEAACTITGTIDFVPAPATPGRGLWTIKPGVINCQGLFRAKRPITGPGAFGGSGTYAAASTAQGPCLNYVGTGEVEYHVPTFDADNRIQEHHDFVFAGAGAFGTPTLRGTFQIVPPSGGNCLSTPMKASFVAEAAMVRLNGLDH